MTLSLHPTQSARLRKELEQAMQLRSMCGAVDVAGDPSTLRAAESYGLPLEIYAPLAVDMMRRCLDAKIAWLQNQLT